MGKCIGASGRKTSIGGGAAAVCILYCPDWDRLRRNIAACLEQVERMYLIDNSEPPIEVPEEIETEDRIRYVGCGGNAGIARALNCGCRLAAEDGFDWVLTLDQDSVIPVDMIGKYKAFLDSGEATAAGMLTCAVKVCEADALPAAAGKTEPVAICYTSGAFMSLTAYRRVGGFEEALFIDGVDFEFCLRMREAGYRIYRLDDVVLDHRLGNSVPYRMFGRHLFYVTHHDYKRRYYMTRNALRINARYGATCPLVRYNLLVASKSVIKILLFEKDKYRKFRSMWRGYKDYRRGIYGKYRWND